MNRTLEIALSKFSLFDMVRGIYCGYLTPMECMAIINDGGRFSDEKQENDKFVENVQAKIDRGESNPRTIYIYIGQHSPLKPRIY